MSRETSFEQARHAWNSGVVVGPKPLLKPKDIWAIRAQLRHQHRTRDLARSISRSTANCGATISCISASLTWFWGQRRPRAFLVQSKTGRPVIFELTEACRESVQGLRPQRNCDWLFPSRSKSGQPMTTRRNATARRLVGSCRARSHDTWYLQSRRSRSP